MRHFTNCKTIEELKQEYKKLARINHPDNGGSADTMKEINAEYDVMFNRLKHIHNAKAENATKQNTEQPEHFRELIEKLMRMNGITIEICGSWIWVTGNTYPHKDELNKLEFQWSKTKKAWYLPDVKGTKKRGTLTMEKIRSKYGSNVLASENEKVLALA